MKMRKPLLVAASLAVFCALIPPALAQTDSADHAKAAPDYDSGVASWGMSDANFNTPESDGRPGVYFFNLGARAFRKGDYQHAINMYQVAASWAYKPAEYNLGVMFYKGQGVPVDRPLGAAWIVLAAERKDPQYVKTQNLFITMLTDAQFERTNQLWRDLKSTYGDTVALPRAKAQWQWAKTHQTGTRTGSSSGPLLVGVLDGGHSPSDTKPNGQSVRMALTPGAMMHGGAVDGSMAYRQLHESDNPYDPIFLKNIEGTVEVKPLMPGDPAGKTDAPTSH